MSREHGKNFGLDRRRRRFNLIAKDEEIENLNWIKASEAFARMIASGDSHHQAKQTLAIALREGQIRARARAIGVSREPLLKRAWKDVKRKKTHRMVPTIFWRSARYFHEDKEHWIWSRSRFHSTLSKDPPKRRIARLVEFCVEDLASINPRAFREGRPKKRRGKPVDLATRDSIWLAVFDVLIGAELADSVWSEKQEFTEALHFALGDANGSRQAGINATDDVARLAFPRVERLRDFLQSRDKP